MAGTPIAPATATISARAQSARRWSLRIDGQPEIGAVVRDAEDQARKARGGDAGDVPELRRAPARFDEQPDPDRADRQVQRRLGPGEEVVEELDLLGMLDLGKDDAVEREGARRRQLADPPQQRVEVADRGLEVEPWRAVEAQRSASPSASPQSASVSVVAATDMARAATSSPGAIASSPSSITRGARLDRASRASTTVAGSSRRSARSAAVRPSRSSILATGAVPLSTALRAIEASAAGVVRCAC